MAVCNSRTVLAEIHGKLCQKGKKNLCYQQTCLKALGLGISQKDHSKTETKPKHNVIITFLEQKESNFVSFGGSFDLICA